MKNRKLELHIIQSLEASNLNRDREGRTKTVEIGGFSRIRVSSQAWKYAMRKMFSLETGKRTRLLPRKIIELLVEKGKKEEDVLDIVKNALAIIFLEKKNRKGEKIKAIFEEKKKPTGVELMLRIVVFVNNDLHKKVGMAILNNFEAFNSNNTEEMELVLGPIYEDVKKNVNVDIALFGRMFATRPDLNMEGAVSMDHSYSVNELAPEEDFFITNDDWAESHEKGAAHLSSSDNAQYFSAPCLFRMCVVDYDLLLSNLNGNEELASDVIKMFIDVFIKTIPKAKQKSMAAFNPPSFILATITSGAPMSLGNAFENPVRIGDLSPSNTSILKLAIERIDSFLKDLTKFYGLPERSYYATIGEHSTLYLDENATKCATLEELIEQASSSLMEME